MSNRIKLVVKTVVFFVIFYFLCVVVAAALRDDANSYARVLMHEFYGQKNIDILYCGASHVSHGITPVIADKVTGKNNFNLGTASQSIDGTYALLRQAVKLYKIEKVFLELDFAPAKFPARKNRTGFSSDYLVAQYIKNPFIKYDFLLTVSPPKYYLNHFLPIGKDKYLTLNPKDLMGKYKKIFSGEYFNYIYKENDTEYDGKGCVLDLDFVKNGTFSNYSLENPIPADSIPADYTKILDKIIKLCKDNSIELIFYSMPCSDFYLNEIGNYDDYYQFCKNFTSSRGFPYYDFNLANEKFLHLEDEDFSDDNHFSKQGVYKWTKVFCDYFFTENIPKDSMFHSSYAEKIAAQNDKIYGLVLLTSTDKKSVDIIPVTNHVDPSRITYNIFSIIDDKRELLTSGPASKIDFPSGKSGYLQIESYMDGIHQNDCQIYFVTF